MIERCHKDKVLIYDNLKGHKWISIEHLAVTYLVWGLVFRRQNHQTYSFQPKQYKAIAPDTLSVNQQSHGPKQSKSRQKNNLGINARKYNCPKQPKKIQKNDAFMTSGIEEPQQELADTNQSNQHGVPMVGSAPTIPHPGATQQAGSTDSQANGQRGVPMVDQLTNDQRVATCHPLPEGITSETHSLANSHDAGNTGHANIVSDAPIATQEPIQAEHAPSHLDNADKVTSGNPAVSREPSTTMHPSKEAITDPADDNRHYLQVPPDDISTGRNPSSRDKDASPPKRIKYSEAHPYAIISLFDGVGSAIPAITKAVGCAPRIVIAAECDPILRQIVGEQFLFRTDGKWTKSGADTFTIYGDDVRQLLKDQCRIFKEAFALAGPHCRWFAIAGSPCQDLTPAGPFKGLLGLTGPCSSFFYYVHVILWLLQMNYPIELIRFLLENAGTMLDIHRKAILRALGLNADLRPDHFRVDPKHTHGIKRNRFYFRNYQDCAQVPKTIVLPGNDIEGPLLDCGGSPIPFGPLLRVRAVLGHDVYQLSWTAYQPISLIWDYVFWGDKKQFQTKARMQCSDAIPALDYAKSLPPHYLRAWNCFVRSPKQKDVSTLERDRLVRAILPIFHHPFIKAPMRILTCEEVEKLAGLHNHFNRVHAHRSLLTELTVRNYCGNSFHPEHIQAAIGHPERLRSWLTEPIEPPTKSSWTGVIHPKQARAQYHALREQVQTLARTQQVRDLASKQVGIDPMPDFPIHAIEGSLSPVMPTIMPVQLLPATRKFRPDELGIRENKPPSQISLIAIQLMQRKQMQDILTGMRFFGAGVGVSEDILPFFFGDNAEAIIERHCPHMREWLMHQLQSCAHCTYAMAQTLLCMYSLLHREHLSIHFVHIVDWEDQAFITAFGEAPAQWTVYCAQFPRSRTFHIDTAAWNCRMRVNIPWQPSPHLVLNTTSPLPFHCINPKCLWFAIPHGPNGQYLISHRVIGTFLYDQCVPCFFSWIMAQVSCSVHTTACTYPTLSGVLFVDHESNVAVAATHSWQVDITTGYQTCLIQAAIDSRLFEYPEHCNTLPSVNAIGKVSPDLATSWNAHDSWPNVAFFLCSLVDDNQ